MASLPEDKQLAEVEQQLEEEVEKLEEKVKKCCTIPSRQMLAFATGDCWTLKTRSVFECALSFFMLGERGSALGVF